MNRFAQRYKELEEAGFCPLYTMIMGAPSKDPFEEHRKAMYKEMFERAEKEKLMKEQETEKKSKWNKIGDGIPPETNKCYLVYVANDKCQYTAYIDDVEHTWFNWNTGVSKPFIDSGSITHWREMPKNPKA